MSHERESATDSFFRDQALYGRYRLPTFIALLTGVVWALQPVALYYALDLEVRENIQNAVATDTMIHFLIPIGLWLYFWITFVVIAHFRGARIKVGRLFKLIGWGMAPFALMGLVRAAGRYYAYQGAEIPVGVTVGRFPSEWNGYHELIGEVSGDPLLVGTTLGSLVFLLLSAYFWIPAVKYSTNLEDRKNILLVVGIPILLYALYTAVPSLL